VEAVGSVMTFYGYGFLLVFKQKKRPVKRFIVSAVQLIRNRKPFALRVWSKLALFWTTTTAQRGAYQPHIVTHYSTN
jgi:hypothetical protein